MLAMQGPICRSISSTTQGTEGSEAGRGRKAQRQLHSSKLGMRKKKKSHPGWKGSSQRGKKDGQEGTGMQKGLQ